MASLPINQIPAAVLKRFDAGQMVLVCNEQLGSAVLGTTTFDPSSLQEIDGLQSLPELREREGVYSITTTILQLSPSVIDRATIGFEQRERIVSELTALLEDEGDV